MRSFIIFHPMTLNRYSYLVPNLDNSLMKLCIETSPTRNRARTGMDRGDQDSVETYLKCLYSSCFTCLKRPKTNPATAQGQYGLAMI